MQFDSYISQSMYLSYAVVQLSSQHLFLHVVSGPICSMHPLLEVGLCNCSCVLKGLLNKRPGDRLGWPGLLDHPFVRESVQERTKREAALADAVLTAQESRAWKGEGGAIAGHQHTSSCCACAASKEGDSVQRCLILLETAEETQC